MALARLARSVVEYELNMKLAGDSCNDSLEYDTLVGCRGAEEEMF